MVESYQKTRLIEFQASIIWHGLQSEDPLLAWVREGEAVMIGDGVPTLP